MNEVNGRAYNYDFKLLMEGISVPFKSANVVCTPNGVEFNINVHVNKELMDIKPKTAVQIFFKEWHTARGDWRLMADGFFSGFVTGEDSQGGRAIGITCRDFRMDIRKSPAAIGWAGSKETLGRTKSSMSTHGIWQKISKKKLIADRNAGEDTVDVDGVATRLYDNSGLLDLASAIERIVGSAFGKKAANTKSGGAYKAFNFSTSEIEDKYGNKKANGGLFLDAFIRGIWMEAVGGTRVNSFMNKRIRADKRFLIPRNFASFNFWKQNNFGLQVGTAMMGNSRFTSLEAAMMNVAGMFSTRVYSCCTPSLISLRKEKNPGLEFVMDEGVRRFLEANQKEFGALYTLNESMLLPPLEFTAPPNCNLFFPPMYDRLNWRRDDDSDITRAYFGVIHSLSTTGGLDFGHVKFQVPNDMFGITDKDVTGGTKEGKKKAKAKLPLTLEERYKGVNVYHGSVEYNLAAADAAKTLATSALTEKKKQEITEENKAKVEEAQAELNKNGGPFAYSGDDGDDPVVKAQKEIDDKAKKQAAKDSAIQDSKKNLFGGAVATAYKRHAMIKYVNLKYQGRVVTVDMAFNPYVMPGFPGAALSALEELNTNVSKTMIGMVQQVSHAIHITPQGADATTTVIMNNVRFEDEPTDLSADGLPLYIKSTDPVAAAVDINTLQFKQDMDSEKNDNGSPKNPYRVPDAGHLFQEDEDNLRFDIKKTAERGEGDYAKDFLSTSQADIDQGKEESIYVDPSYEPNRVFKFYEEVFGHKEHHFMLGFAEGSYFAYNSMHEAFVKLRENRPDLLNDYTACMKYVERNICSADAFYHGILGLSSRETYIPIDGTEEVPGYVNRTSEFIDNIISSEYFGVSSDYFDLNAQEMADLNMDEAGQFSSIREFSPITAFIQERRDAVKAYKKAATSTVAGVVFDG